MKKIIGKPSETNDKLIKLIENLKVNNFYLNVTKQLGITHKEFDESDTKSVNYL